MERWRQTEDRHYAISPLRWATTFFAESGDAAGARTCAAALAQLAADAGHDEAMSALSHALGETALLDGSAEQAADQFARALGLLQGLDMPFDRAETERRAAAALARPRPARGSRGAPGRRPSHGPPPGRPAAGGTADRRAWPPSASGPSGGSAAGRSPRRPAAA